VFVKKKLPDILGCGAGLKSTVCLTKDNYAFLSQHIGDLDNHKIFEFYKNSIDHLQTILDIKPDIIACDMHPGYMSTGFAQALEQESESEGRPVKLVEVQHHHAHAVSCMAEHDLDEEVIALTLDGTGYGIDGKIWGGEILVCDNIGFKRKAHLSYVPMPGGDAAVLEPWRMAASFLFKAYGNDFLNLKIPYLKQMDKEKLSFIVQMMEKKLNSPETSSTGRLFDAVSSLLCIRHKISHESQAAMELEAIAIKNDTVSYEFNLINRDNQHGENMIEIDMIPCVRDIVEDIAKKESVHIISFKFHQSVVDSFVSAAIQIIKESGIKKAVLSGGVFNNDIILNGIRIKLEQEGFNIYTHTKVPAGDGGISFGQAAVAAALEGVRS